jgi:hypothetical protein
MKQKKIEQISHDINVDVILKCLWAIRDNDQFYFNAYGKEMIEKCIEQKLKKESKLPIILNSGERLFTESEISQLQSKVHKITGDGEVMQLFNSLLGVNSGGGS